MADIRLPNLNLVLLAGRATADPDLRYTPKGTAVLQFQLAVNRRYLDRATNEWKEDPSFFTVVVWGEQAERVGERIKKGSAVMLEGEMRSRTWDDKEGRKRTVVEVHARRVQVLDRFSTGRSESGPGAAGLPDSSNPDGPETGSDQLDDIPF
ncbi:MAG TPA: single-stranded DNA-binding protein [candidate division WOR-3 bacterium]|uniref:Single-stranded DNA-binding protein n=1 Tax=candidate division WOR-3 bacterium TaxID=2052148 RepID=A0A7V0XEZ7_UNCW3|nr:single-stranded DNA-binding protein [candidate division WOR-3 bacterium]